MRRLRRWLRDHLEDWSYRIDPDRHTPVMTWEEYRDAYLTSLTLQPWQRDLAQKILDSPEGVSWVLNQPPRHGS